MTPDIGVAVRAILAVRTDTAKRTGCTEWGGEGVRAALIETGGSLGGGLAAAALAAEDPTLVKPSARAFRNHFPVNATEQPRVSHATPCPSHPDQDEPCPHPDHSGDMTPEQIREWAAKCRAEIRTPKESQP